MAQQTFVRSVAAGVAGTFAMTVLMLMGPMMGMPEMNVGSMLGSFTGVGEAIGWIMHFMIGSVLALIYAYLFADKLPGTSAVKGAIYGVIPWFVAQIVVNPMMGAGVFASNTPSPALMVLGSLMGHLVYGAVVGIAYGLGKRAEPVPSHS